MRDSPRKLSLELANKLLAKGQSLEMMTLLTLTAKTSKTARGEGADFDLFNDYGCYCQPSEEAFLDGSWIGKGVPVDEIDQKCHDLFQGYQCLKHDFQSCSHNQPLQFVVNDDGTTSCGNIWQKINSERNILFNSQNNNYTYSFIFNFS